MKYKQIPFREEEKKLIGKLYPEEKAEDKWNELLLKQRRLMVQIAALFFILFIFYIIFGKGEKGYLYREHYIKRPQYGEEEAEIILSASGKSMGTEKMSLTVSPRRYGEEEREEAFRQAKKYITDNYLGENKSAGQVAKDLVLMTRIPHSLIRVKWQLSEDGIILENGKINRELLRNGTKETKITAILKYEEWSQELIFSLKVSAENWTKKEAYQFDFKENLIKEEKESSMKEYLSLPDYVNGEKIIYREAKKNYTFVFVVLGITAVLLIPFNLHQQLKAKEKERKRQLESDYPNLINKFVLLLGAGMTILGSFEKIGSSYQKKRESGGYMRYAYEEILLVLKNIKNGVSEVKAYEIYGRRIELLPYLKFSTLISQNLRKGNAGILELLELESVDALERRKEFAKKQGEEAGTKLLFPMILMLVLVMFLIMVPAFMTF